MSLLGAWWRQICQPLDGLLWKKGISHGVIRPLLRNQILLAGALILLGGIIFIVWSWLFWAGCGFAVMTWILYSWAAFFLRADIGSYNAAFLRIVILRFGIRLLLLAVLLYIALRFFSAPAGAILVGLVTGTILGLVNFTYYMRKGA